MHLVNIWVPKVYIWAQKMYISKPPKYVGPKIDIWAIGYQKCTFRHNLALSKLMGTWVVNIEM